MNATDKKLIQTIRSSRFQKLAEMFVYANKIAYVNLRLFQEYFSKSEKNPEFKEYAEGSLADAAFYLDRSIKILSDIRSDASRLLPSVKSASLNPSEAKEQIMKGVESYVRVEKDWESLRKMADALERTGTEEGEDLETAREDIVNLLQDIVISCDKSISVFRRVQNKILDEIGA